MPIAMLTLLDPSGSAEELERAVKDGCHGCWVNPFNHNKVIHGHSDHDVLFEKCVELDVPLAIHPTFHPYGTATGIFDWPAEGDRYGRDDLASLDCAASLNLVFSRSGPLIVFHH